MGHARLMKMVVVSLLGGVFAMVTPSCGDIAVASVKNGIYSWVSGSLSSTFENGQLNTYLGNLVSGSSGTSTTDSGL